MSEYSSGSFQFAERIMNLKVEEALREANARNLQRQARAGRSASQPFYSGALAWLGHRMANWGEHLLERYSAEGSTSRPQSAEAL